MFFHVLTLFPDMIRDGFATSILGRAAEKGILSLEAVNIRDYTKSRHKKVDDYPYGGGAGMLMQAQPVYDACQAVMEGIQARRETAVLEGSESGRDAQPGNPEPERDAQPGDQEPERNVQASEQKRVRVIYLTPTGQVFSQQMARELAKEEDLIFLCGHYEGIDERVLKRIVTDYVSIGDYVLTGGELPAMVMMDAIARNVPGVLGNEESAQTESFDDGLLEYPQYTRPEVWEGESVPEILLSGDHAKVEEWRLEKSLAKTKEVRPELYESWAESHQEYFVKKAKKEERLRRKLLKEERKKALEEGS